MRITLPLAVLLASAFPACSTGPSQPQPRLVEEGFGGEFNIIKYGNKYYALPQNEGAFDIKKIEEQEYKRFFVGNSLGEVKALIP